MNRSTLFILLGLLLLPGACVKDNFDFDRFSDKVSYRPAFMIPLVTGSLTLGNLLEPDDSLVIFHPDNSITLVIREDSILQIMVGSILEIPVPEPVSRQFPVNPVRLEPFSSGARITLAELVAPGRMNDPEASAINIADGRNIVFPAVPVQEIGSFATDPLEDIEYAHFTQGEVRMTVTNNLPVGVTIDLAYGDNQGTEQAGRFIFENLGPGQTASRTASLSEKQVYKNMSLDVLSFSSPGSQGTSVLIDLENDLQIEISSDNLLARKGIARVLPVVTEMERDMLEMDFPSDYRIDTLSLESGKVSYAGDNSSKGMRLNVEMSNVFKSGDPYSFDFITDGTGGISGGDEYFSDTGFNLADFDNNVIVSYRLITGSEEGMTEFDIAGGMLGFDLHFSDFTAGFVSGYFGQERLLLDDVQFDLDFSRVTGDFRFTDPSVRIFYENSIGVPVNLNFNLDGRPLEGTRHITLFDFDHQGFNLEFPVESFTTAPGEISVTRETSEVVDLIALPPSRIMFFDGSILKNPEGDTGVPNFITSESSIKMGMDIVLPLEMQLADLGLQDTVGIDFNPDNTGIFELLIMDLELTNGFPVSITLDVDLYDSVQNLVLHRFENIALMKAAPVDEYGVVLQGGRTASTASVELSGITVDYLGQASHMIITARIDTGEHDSQQVPIKFETTNSLDFRIKIRTQLKIEN